MKSKYQNRNGSQDDDGKVYDLEERTAQFGEDTIDFAKTLERDEIKHPLIGQGVRSSTSVGANYVEADGAESKRDFRHKIALCKKGSQGNETLVADDCQGQPGQEQRVPESLERSTRIEFDFFFDLAKREKSLNRVCALNFI
jgi:hypothetical protein